MATTQMKVYPPPAKFITARFAQRVVQDLQAHFEYSLNSWLEVCYGLVKTGLVRNKNGQEHRYPQLYINDSKNHHLIIAPDSKAKSFCFFELNSPMQWDGVDIANKVFDITYDLGIVCWLNLPKIDTRPYDFTMDLVHDMQHQLIRTVFAENLVINSIDARPETVFSKYSYRQTDKQFLMYPYSGFRIDITVKETYCGEYYPFELGAYEGVGFDVVEDTLKVYEEEV